MVRFSSENEFKRYYCKQKEITDLYNVFYIETEETQIGFPDVLLVVKETQEAKFLEFKYTKTDVIRFQHGQIAFYRKYKDLDITLIAYSVKNDKIYKLKIEEIINKKEPILFNLEDFNK